MKIANIETIIISCPCPRSKGDHGFLKVLGNEGIKGRQRLGIPFGKREGFLITNYGYKLKVGDGTCQNPSECAVYISREHEIDPEKVKTIKVFAGRFGIYKAFENPERKYPMTKEDADHSLWYCVARALSTATYSTRSSSRLRNSATHR